MRFTGSLRTFHNRRHVNAQLIRILEDQNEAYFHFNEVMAVTLYHRYGTVRLNPSCCVSAPLLTHALLQLKDRQGGGSSTGYGNASVSNYHQAATSHGNNEQFEDLPPLQRAVLEFMRGQKAPSEDGHHVRALAKGVQHISTEPADVAYVFPRRLDGYVGANKFDWCLGRRLTS